MSTLFLPLSLCMPILSTFPNILIAEKRTAMKPIDMLR
jgi:hypothetical protein